MNALLWWKLITCCISLIPGVIFVLFFLKRFALSCVVLICPAFACHDFPHQRETNLNGDLYANNICSHTNAEYHFASVFGIERKPYDPYSIWFVLYQLIILNTDNCCILKIALISIETSYSDSSTFHNEWFPRLSSPGFVTTRSIVSINYLGVVWTCPNALHGLLLFSIVLPCFAFSGHSKKHSPSDQGKFDIDLESDRCVIDIRRGFVIWDAFLRQTYKSLNAERITRNTRLHGNA